MCCMTASEPTADPEIAEKHLSRVERRRRGRGLRNAGEGARAALATSIERNKERAQRQDGDENREDRQAGEAEGGADGDLGAG